jgi:hypothetical protein
MAVSGLETLPPDQRAVLQLILVQGRGYGDLASMLKLDAAAVRERALAGVDGLGLPAGAELDAATRGRVVDYLLGQQDDGDRIVTFAELGESTAACRWAGALRERLAGIAREELPEVPASAVAPSTNGSAAHAEAATALAAAPAPPVPVQPAAVAAAPAAVAAATAPAASTTSGGTAPPSPPSDGPARPVGPSGPRPSRLGGAILIAGAAALAIVLTIVLTGGGGGARTATSATTAQTQASTGAQASTGTNGTTTAASRAPAARPIAAAVLKSPTGGSAIGAGIVQPGSNGSRLLAVEAGRLAPNSASDVYAIWLQGSAGSRFMGFVPSRVGSSGTFTVSASLDRGLSLASYPTLLVTREGVSAVPATPGTVVLSGQLRSTG